jgi:hypothetical protein
MVLKTAKGQKEMTPPWARGNEDKRPKRMEVKDLRDPEEQRTKDQRTLIPG